MRTGCSNGPILGSGIDFQRRLLLSDHTVITVVQVVISCGSVAFQQ